MPTSAACRMSFRRVGPTVRGLRPRLPRQTSTQAHRHHGSDGVSARPRHPRPNPPASVTNATPISLPAGGHPGHHDFHEGRGAAAMPVRRARLLLRDNHQLRRKRRRYGRVGDRAAAAPVAREANSDARIWGKRSNELAGYRERATQAGIAAARPEPDDVIAQDEIRSSCCRCVATRPRGARSPVTAVWSRGASVARGWLLLGQEEIAWGGQCGKTAKQITCQRLRLRRRRSALLLRRR